MSTSPEHPELGVPGVRVDRDSERGASEGDLLGRGEGEELGRVDVLLGLRDAALGPLPVAAWVVVAGPELPLLGGHHVGAHTGDERPDASDGRPRQLTLHDLGVQDVSQTFHVIAGERTSVERPQRRQDVISYAAAIVVDAVRAAVSVVEPTLRIPSTVSGTAAPGD